jgi:hypothetical protein
MLTRFSASTFNSRARDRIILQRREAKMSLNRILGIRKRVFAEVKVCTHNLCERRSSDVDIRKSRLPDSGRTTNLPSSLFT